MPKLINLEQLENLARRTKSKLDDKAERKITCARLGRRMTA